MTSTEHYMAHMSEPDPMRPPARDDDPSLHRIEVERDGDSEVTWVRFICDGDDTAPCHHYPACGCETWTRELHGIRAGQRIYEHGHTRVATEDEAVPPQPGHEDVQQRDCWIDPWFNATTSTWSDFTDLYDGRIDIDNPDIYGEHADWLVSGSVSVAFEGDYMTWEYAS